MSLIKARFRGRLGGFRLDAGFTLPATGVTGLFGPSGCGKTTILRCMAGLTRLREGYLAVGDEVWQDSARFTPPHRRPVGYVFQEPRLFSHLSVLENLRYGLKRARDTSAIKLEPVVELLGITPFLARSPATLSGGERQRIAVGRALLSQPRLLLMDEPLSALDRQSKQEILPYLESLSGTLALPIIYVSHAIGEIERLCDHLLLMTKDGRVEAEGPLAALLTDLSLSPARAPEASAVLSVRVARYDDAYDLTACTAAGLPVLVPGRLGADGSVRRLRVRASDVSLAKSKPEGTSVLNILPARILSADQVRPNQTLLLLGLGESAADRLLCSITRKSWEELGLAPGARVFAQIKSMSLAEAE